MSWRGARRCRVRDQTPPGHDHDHRTPCRPGRRRAWVAGDEVYGADPHLRATCRRLGLGYVLAIGCNRAVPTGAGPLRADRATGLLPPGAWARMSCGDGSKGRRWYSWAVLELQAEADGPDLGSGHHSLLVRRNDTTGELAWYRCWTPRPAAIGDLVRVAGRRWTVEENFQAAKSHTGLDEHQVRRWNSWHRWTTLAMLAHAFLTVLAVVMNDANPPTTRAGLIAITSARPDDFRRPRPTRHDHRSASPGLVPMATTTPAPRPTSPLPTTRRQHHRSPQTRSTGSRAASARQMASCSPCVRSSMPSVCRTRHRRARTVPANDSMSASSTGLPGVPR